MQITVYGGAGVIGGNKVLLEADGKNIFFDFGISYSVYGNYFEEFLKPRSARGIIDFFETGLLPPIHGIYRSDYFPSAFEWEKFEKHPDYRKLELSGILLSHAHLDHSGHIAFLDEATPIYTSSLTTVLAKAVQDTSQPDLDKEVCYKVAREENDGILKSAPWRNSSAIGRPFRLVNPGKINKETEDFWGRAAGARGLSAVPLSEASSINGMKIVRYTVDHSIFGSSAFAVETSQGWVVYTGDVRLHGKKGDLTRSFAAEVAKLKPFLLITEGTRIYGADGSIDIGYDDNVDEEFVFENCHQASKGVKGLLIADFGPRNLERLLIFLEIAKHVGRKLAIMAKDAYLLEAVHTVIPHEVPHPLLDESVVLYRDVKSAEKGWEKEILEKYAGKLVDGRKIRSCQSDYIVCMSFLDINELIDISPDHDAAYIYSSSEAYSEEQKIDFKRLLNWLSLYGVRPIGVPDPVTGKVLASEKGLHASGHITAPELVKLIRTMNPKIIVPVHTQHPEFFVKELEEYQVLVPEHGKPLVI